jgi:hypothetical protein
MPHTKLLIEQWLPIAPLGAERMRDQSAAKKPPESPPRLVGAAAPDV